MVKLIITLISVPMGIIAFRRKNKIIATSLLVVFVYIYGVAETKSFRFKKEKITIKYEVSPKVGDSNSTADNILQANENNISVKGKIIYEKICASCHGIDGKLGMSGAKDLTLSTLSLQEKISVINRGKNLMNGYKDVLTEDEIEAVALYVHGMKK